MRRTASAAFLASTSALGACSVSRVPLTVTVRDTQSKQPIAGAVVIADTPNRNHPFSISSILGQTGPSSAKGTTDAQGRVVLGGIEDRPVRIGVFTPDHGPAFGLFDEIRSADWSDLRSSDQPDGRGVEARVERGDSPPR